MKCPICSFKSRYKFDSEINRKIYQCQSIKCKHLFIETFAEDTGICGTEDRGEDLSYEKLKLDRENRINTYNKRNQLMFKSMFQKLNLKEDANVLDFGSGDGNLIYSLKSVFPKSNVTCIEPHNIFRELLQEVADKIVDSASELEEKFDLIVMNEVIEHLNFPILELKQLSKLLKDQNAGLYIATPLGETHLFSNKTLAYNIYSHLQFFTRKSLNYCLNESGFTALDIDDINYPIYNSNFENKLKIKTKNILKKFVLSDILNLKSRYCILPGGHISGLAYKK